MSLKRFNILLVLISLIGMLALFAYFDKILQQNISASIENSILRAASDLRERERSDFDTLVERFAQYEKMSVAKLKKVAKAASQEDGEINLSAIAREINANVYDGHYEISIINDRKVVEKSTYKGKIGLDFKAYPYYSHILDRLTDEDGVYKISAPVFDAYTLDIAQSYTLKSPKGYWIKVEHVLPFDEYVGYRKEQLKERFPSLVRLDLFILTANNIQYINTDEQKNKTVNNQIDKNSFYASMLIKDLGLTTPQDSTAVETIALRFLQNDMTSVVDTNNEEIVYALTTSSFEKTADDFMVIGKMHFDESYYMEDYSELKNLLYLFVAFVFIFTLLTFILIYRSVIMKISMITQQMHREEPIQVDGYLFSEFRFFVKRYNLIFSNWQDEVRRLHDITTQDELTKCANRRYFNQKIASQIDLFERYGQEFSMIMFDIDDFKHINDTYGHSLGDHVLKLMAIDVQEHLRTSDILCRIGGEEFAVILPETNRESALFVAEKIRKHIEEQVYIDHETITISLGAESFSEGQDFNSFYAAVDSFLYKSKNSGKNCVHSSESVSS
ncbi:MAG: GGDEF domain-containing protein [Helicobacteraceae bacterium]|jgi:diguanylate cyclase (GGDEF)-like protein|nr:GGDEF domain-containing protein [Helicobacteraceae bacterium]